MTQKLSSSVIAHDNVGGEIDSKAKFMSHDFREEINSKTQYLEFCLMAPEKKEGNYYVKGCLLLRRQAP